MGGKGARNKNRKHRDPHSILVRDSRRIQVDIQGSVRTCGCPAWERHHPACPANRDEQDEEQISVLEKIERRVARRVEAKAAVESTKATVSAPSAPVADTDHGRPWSTMVDHGRAWG